MILQRRSALRTSMLLMVLVSVMAGQNGPVPTSKIPLCGKPAQGQKSIGWGKYGLFFRVPERDVTILGGKPDVDYVKFVIKPKHHEAFLVLWFGGMAFHPDPPGETLSASASFTQTKLLNADGIEIGLDTMGVKPDKSRWRWFGVFSEGAEYENATAEDAVLFDKILDSACLIPYPKE